MSADRYLPDGWILPSASDHYSVFFTDGELVLQRCASCGHVQHPPGDVCVSCGSFDFEWEPTRPEGVISTFTVVHHPVHELLAGAVPYNIVVVELDNHAGIRIVGNVINRPANDLEIGMRVVGEFTQPLGEEPPVRLLQWRVIDEAT